MKKLVLAVLLSSICCHTAAALALEPKADAKNLQTTAMKSYLDPTTRMEFVFVKGGCFQMGGAVFDYEKPVHEVCVKDFYLGKYEVTQAQWEKIMGSNPAEFKQCGPACPVESVSWADVGEFARRLSEKSKQQYRLPTEAEWEFAARNRGTDEKWAGTSEENSLAEYAWYQKNAKNSIHPVGQKKPNGLGLYDMSGNVWEWCSDWYSETYYSESPKDNPAGPATGEFRAARGGSFDNVTDSVRGANRDYLSPETKGVNKGFRLLYLPN